MLGTENTSRLTALLCLAAVLGSCRGEPAPGKPGTPVDESAINNVWHKAKLRGVAFRAIGQEPGWLLEISNGEEILLVTDYGSNRRSMPYVDPIEYPEERRTEFVLEDFATTIEIRGEPCTDVMSGESFEVTVIISLDDGKLQGCGRALF